MDRGAFENGLDLYGPNFARWPQGLREAGERLVLADPVAAGAHATAQKVAEASALWAAPAPLSSAAWGRLIENLSSRQAARRLAEWPLLRPRSALAFSMALVVVFGLGAWAGTLEASLDDAVAAIVLEDAALVEDI